MFFETTGAVSPHTFNIIKKIARAGTDDPNQRDGSRYSRNRRATRSFLTHHLQQICSAIVYNDATTILKNITILKQQAHRVPPPAPLLANFFPDALFD